MINFDRNRKLICTDLDGTMFPFSGTPDPRCMNRLKQLLRKNPDVILCYVTGRSLKLSLEAIAMHGLPQPRYLITDVGTSIYHHNRKYGWVLDGKWHSKLSKSWKSSTSKTITLLMDGVDGIKSQGNAGVSEFKSSFYLSKNKKNKALRELHKRLNALGIAYTLSISKGKEKHLLLDVLAKGASKKSAVNALMERLGTNAHNTSFSGDSENDFALLTTNLNTILVNNASDSLKQKVVSKAAKKSTAPTLYLSNGSYDCCKGNDVCGVLEGLLHFGMFSRIKNKGIYVQIHSLHGLISSNYADLGRDEDTGGQIVYVLELAKAMSKIPAISQVDILTRRIEDSRYPNYGKRMEYINRKLKIVRIDCGGKGYIKKTDLWPFIGEYVENVLKYVEEMGRSPDVIHANYADAGLAGAMLAEKLGSIMVFTGHSLGIPKMRKLGANKKNYGKLDARYKFSKRVAAEQSALDKADSVIVSTNEELANQYSGYALDKYKVRVISPGIDLHMFNGHNGHESKRADVLSYVTKGLAHPRLKMILAVSRLDPRKNVEKLVEVFCNNPKINNRANLILVTGLKRGADSEQRAMLDRMKMTVSRHKCEEKVSFVKFIDSEGALAALYHIARKSGGMFVNPALIEPFGLTVLEASACGLPVIATKNGGPAEIISNGHDGILIDPRSSKGLSNAILRLISNKRLWSSISKNATHNALRYSWYETAKAEVSLFRALEAKRSEEKIALHFGRTFHKRAPNYLVKSKSGHDTEPKD